MQSVFPFLWNHQKGLEISCRNRARSSVSMAGPTLAGNTEMASPFQFREGVRRREKQKLGKEAVKLIQKGDTLIIESSTTTAEFVKELCKSSGTAENSDDCYKFNSHSYIGGDGEAV